MAKYNLHTRKWEKCENKLFLEIKSKLFLDCEGD